MNKPVKLLIAEWVPSLNKGELAILIGMLRTFKPLGDVKVSIFSFDPSSDKKCYPKSLKLIDVCGDLYINDSLSTNSKFRKVRNILYSLTLHFSFVFLYKLVGKKVLYLMNGAIWQEYCNSDVILICHDQVNCVSGFILDYSPVYITLLAKALHKPIVIYGNGTTTLDSPIWRFLARYVLNNVDLITVRTQESFSYLKKFVWNKNRIYFTGDPAVLLPPADPVTTKLNMNEANIQRTGSLLIGAALSREVLSNAFRICAPTSAGYKRALIEFARLFDDFIENFGATLVFIPHCIEPYQQNDDRIVAHEIYNLMKNKDMVRILNKEYPPEELKGILSELDLFISTRVHSAIGALTMNVPTIIITSPMDRRAYGLIGKNLKQDKWIYNIKDLDAKELYSCIVNLLSCSNKIRETLPHIVNSAKRRALLNGVLLETFLKYWRKRA